MKIFLKPSIFIICFILIFSNISPIYAEKIDINRADFELLITLPEIDELMAAKIHKYRKNNSFKSIYDLMKIDGMTGEKFQKLVNKITVGTPLSPSEEKSKEKIKTDTKKTDKPLTINKSSGLSTGRKIKKKRKKSTRGRIGSGNSLRRISRKKFTPMSIFKAAFGLSRRGKFEMAEKLFTQFLDKNPTHKYSGDAKYLRASCYEEMNRFNEAISIYGLVYNNRYSRLRSIALFRSAICYDKLKDYDKALTNYNKFIREFPESQWIKTVSDRLKELN